MLNVFYRPEQCAPQSAFSPSSIKPRHAVADWLRHFPGQLQVCSFEPVSRADFCLAHAPDMVHGILDGTRSNGFGNTSAAVARSLPYTTGSLLAAAEDAVLHRRHACSPTSGFHHATHDVAQAYCSFNGLMVVALMLRRAGLVHTVGILDCDMHWGNGTEDIIQTQGLDWVRHHSLGGAVHRRADARPGADGQSAFTRWLRRAIDDVRGCDLVLYQAGADPHVADPLGGLLDTEDMRLRDRMVFEGLRGRPLAWNLAGGYQCVDGIAGDDDAAQAARLAPVLALHRNTVQEQLQVLDR